MKRFACVCGGLAVLMMTGKTFAAPVLTTNNGLAVWFDVRSNGATGKNQLPQSILTPSAPFTNGISVAAGAGKAAVGDVPAVNLGGPGDAPVLFLSPRLPTFAGKNLDPATGVAQGLHWAGTSKKRRRDFSVGSLFVYATVGDRAAALNEVISALGRDTAVVKQGKAAKGTKLQSLAFVPNTAIWSIGGVSTTVTDNLGNQTDFTISNKAVMVPVSDPGGGPIFDTSATAGGGLGVAPVGGVDTLYQLGEVQVAAREWDNGSLTHVSPGRFATYTLRDSVNNLLITRAYDGAGPTPELPDLGYLAVTLNANNNLIAGAGGTSPEAAGGDGSTIGTTSATEDAIIVITSKFDGNNDGTVNTVDIADFQAALSAGAAGTLRQREVYLFDGNNDRSVNTVDISVFQTFLLLAGTDCSGGCP